VRGTGQEAEEARAHARRLAERDAIHALDERITADALALARRRWGRGFDPDGTLARLGLDFQCTQALLGWSSDHTVAPTAGPRSTSTSRSAVAASMLRAARSSKRSARHASASTRSSPRSRGRSIALRDLLAGGERTVEEKSASRTVRTRDVLLTRVVDLGDRSILAGCHLRSLPPREGDEARRRLRSALRVRAAKVPAEKLREATADGTLFRIWQEIVDAGDARPTPRLQNTDGEDLILTVDRFDVAAGKADEVVARLLDLPDAQQDDGEEDGAVIVSFVREGNARGVLPTTLIGRAILEGGLLRLETNSRERADRLRALLAERLGALVSFRIREHNDLVAHTGEGLARGARPAPPEPMPPEVIEVVKRTQAEDYRSWLDEEIPTLGGISVSRPPLSRTFRDASEPSRPRETHFAPPRSGRRSSSGRRTGSKPGLLASSNARAPRARRRRRTTPARSRSERTTSPTGGTSSRTSRPRRSTLQPRGRRATRRRKGRGPTPPRSRPLGARRRRSRTRSPARTAALNAAQEALERIAAALGLEDHREALVEGEACPPKRSSPRHGRSRSRRSRASRPPTPHGKR
jgi:hypothetical protein